MLRVLMLTAVVALAQGCTVYQTVPLRTQAMPGAPVAGQAGSGQQVLIGLSIGEIMQMLRANRPQSEIIAELRTKGLRVAPAPADLDVLGASGATPELLEALRLAPTQLAATITGGTPQPVAAPLPPTTLVTEVWHWTPYSFGLGFAPWWSYSYVPAYPYRWSYPVYRGPGWYRPAVPRVHPPGVGPAPGVGPGPAPVPAPVPGPHVPALPGGAPRHFR